MANTKVTSNVISDDITLGGNPTTTTQSAGNNTTRIATTAFVKTAIDATIDSAPGALDTLNELAAAIGDDANFSTTVTNSIATKLPLAGGTMTGDLILGDNVKVEIGSASGGDLQLYHDGSNSYIHDAGTGQLRVSTSEFKVLNAAQGEAMIAAVENGAVTLYYDNAAKLATASGGVAVTGDITSSGNLHAGDGTNISMDSSANGQIEADGNGYQGAIALDGTAMHIYHNSSSRSLILGTNETERLTIDGTGKVGIGTTSPTRTFTVKSAAANSTQISLVDNDSTNEVFAVGQQSDGDGFLTVKQDDGTTKVLFDASGDSYINGGKVGIGTTSPNDELDIAAVHSQLRLTDTDDSKFVQFSYSGGKLVTRNNDASTTVNQFTLTEDGKFGIGTISPDTLLHINNLPDDKFMTFEQNGRKHAIGTYFSSNANDSRLEFYMSDGNTNGSNNNRLTIKGNGNVGIGTASPTKPLSVYAGDANGNIVLTRAGTSENLTLGTYYITATSNDLQLASSAGKMTFSAGGSERMRIESNGKVGINNTDPTGYYSDNLVVGSDDEGGITIASSASSHKSYLMFADGTSGSAAYRGSVGYDHNLDSLSLGTGGGTNRLTIDGSGRTGIGTTTTGGARLTVEEGDNTKIGAYIVNSSTAIANSSASLLYLQATGDAAIGDGYKLVQFADSDTVLGTISSASSSSAVAYNTTSDERLKENIVDMPSQIENILKVQPRQFDWKKNGNTSKGFVAQELHKIYPEAVTVGLEDETQDPWSVDYGRLTPFIIKAIQEQQEQIEQLKTEIQAIKDKHPKG